MYAYAVPCNPTLRFTHTPEIYIYKQQSQAQLTSTTVLALLAMLIRNMPKLEIKEMPIHGG